MALLEAPFPSPSLVGSGLLRKGFPGAGDEPTPMALRTERSPAHVFRDALWVGVGTGVATGVVLAVWVGLLNGWALSLDVFVLAFYLSIVYGALVTGSLFLVASGAVLLGRRPERRLFVAITAAGYVTFNALLRFHLAAQFVTDTPHMTILGVVDLVVILACGVGTARIFLATDGRQRLRGVVAVGIALLALWGVNRWHERPLRRDLGAIIPELLESTEASPPAEVDAVLEDTRLVVLGFDGLSWELLLDPLRQGSLPGFRSLLEGAAFGYLETLPKVEVAAPASWSLTSVETLSPVIWETISTGQHPAEHGIGHFYQYTLPGMSRGIWHIPTFSRGHGPMGLRLILRQPPEWPTPWKRVPLSSADAKVARFFEVAELHGISVGSLNWMNTGPAVPMNGFMRGRTLAKPRYYPPEIVELLPPVPPGRPPRWADLPSTRERDRYERVLYEQFVLMAQHVPVELLMYYTHFHDGTNHHYWKHEAHDDAFWFSGLSHPELEPSEVALISLRFLDDILVDILARLPEDATVVVLSDHGFDWREYKHHNAPPGVFIARGPGIAPGLLPAGTVFDVAPTLLHWLGLPVADDMLGSPLAIAEPGGPLDREVKRVASHGAAKPISSDGDLDPEELKKLEEELRALGYLN